MGNGRPPNWNGCTWYLRRAERERERGKLWELREGGTSPEGGVVLRRDEVPHQDWSPPQ